MSSIAKFALVTGANKGIGLEIVRQLCTIENMNVILTARNIELGEQAVREINSDKVIFHQLDINDEESIKNFKHDLVKDILPSDKGLDILINNAGFAYHGNIFGLEEAKHTINTNYHGTRRVCEALEDLVVKSATGTNNYGRIINVCSMAGRLTQVNEKLQARFAADDVTTDKLDALENEFYQAIINDNLRTAGWPKSMYGISKLLEIAYTKMLARKLESTGVQVTACCPGYCATDMSSMRGYKTAAQGAETPVFLATQKFTHSPNGRFFQEEREIQW